MGNIKESALELIGGTPVLKLNRYAEKAGLQGRQSLQSWNI